jgi:hypothetical protein
LDRLADEAAAAAASKKDKKKKKDKDKGSSKASGAAAAKEEDSDSDWAGEHLSKLILFLFRWNQFVVGPVAHSLCSGRERRSCRQKGSRKRSTRTECLL